MSDGVIISSLNTKLAQTVRNDDLDSANNVI